MIDQMQTLRWTPVELGAWRRCAYGRQVMLLSESGTLRTALGRGIKQICLFGKVDGRMLIEAYCNGAQLFGKLVTNESFMIPVDLPRGRTRGANDIEIQFIPATFGVVRIARDVGLSSSEDSPSALLNIEKGFGYDALA